MTGSAVFVPVVGAAVLAMVVTTLHRRLPPAIAARVVAMSLIVVTGTALPTLWLVSIGYLAHVPYFGADLQWCPHTFGVHDQTPTWIGIPATALAIVGIVRVVAVARSYRRLGQHVGTVDVAPDDRAFAFTLPGSGGHIVVSSGLMDLLDEAEYDAVLAHEAAHGRHRHDRYLVIARVAAASMPLLKSLASRLEFSLERWADEAAAVDHGREFVARTLGKVALAGSSPTGAMGFDGLGVPARVRALLHPPVASPGHVLVGAITIGITTTAALAGYQIHHLVYFVAALCPG